MDTNIIQELVKSLPAAIWTLAGAMIWLCVLATYVIVFEQRRRKRTSTTEDDWR